MPAATWSALRRRKDRWGSSRYGWNEGGRRRGEYSSVRATPRRRPLKWRKRQGWMRNGLSRLVLPVRIELTTSPLPRECSTTEQRQRRPRRTDRLPWRYAQSGGKQRPRRGDVCHSGRLAARRMRGCPTTYHGSDAASRGDRPRMSTDDDKEAKRERAQRERQQRRAAELRANLKRRKARGRTGADAAEADETGPEALPGDPRDS